MCGAYAPGGYRLCREGRYLRPTMREKGDDVRILRSLTDRLLGRVAPEVTASALWIRQYRCLNYGCANRGQGQYRDCQDSTGYCGPWYNDGCGC